MPADEYTAENLSVEESEDGFELHITTEAGLFIFNIQGALGPFLRGTEKVVNYVTEGEYARAARHVTDDDRHSLHADIWDGRPR